MKLINCLLALMVLSITAKAQEEKEEKSSEAIVIKTDGIRYEKTTKGTKKEKSIDVTFAAVDIGINSIQDNSKYPEPISFAGGPDYLNVPITSQNSNLFDLRTGKSINVNLWPVLAKVRAFKTRNQKMYFSTGIGLQINNFRYTNPLEYTNNPVPMISWDSFTTYKKNKLTIVYLSVPLSVTFKTRMANKLWLVYGFGITGGYRISSYTKQVSDKYGKQKDHGNFALANFNSAVTAEFGLDNYFRLYASYQLTNMYNMGGWFDQRPFCIGLRFGGI